MNPLPSHLPTATFGGGCFWCTEAIFKDVRGVTKVTSGYAGGTVPNPSYEHVCDGSTGHAEVIQLEYDPAVVNYEQLLEIFFLTHDPTSMNRQGNDVGTQYRSVVFFASEAEKQAVESVVARLDAEHIYDKPIVTAVVPFTNFYPAEEYHQNYFAKNPDQPYCQAVINPKIGKFRKRFAPLLKSSS